MSRAERGLSSFPAGNSRMYFFSGYRNWYTKTSRPSSRTGTATTPPGCRTTSRIAVFPEAWRIVSTYRCTILPWYNSSCFSTKSSGFIMLTLLYREFRPDRFWTRESFTPRLPLNPQSEIRNQRVMSAPGLCEMKAVLHHDTTVHYHAEAGAARSLSGWFIHQPVLRPDRLCAGQKRLVHNLRDVLDTAKDIHHIGGFRQGHQIGVRRHPQDLRDAGIHGDKFISMIQQVAFDPVAV